MANYMGKGGFDPQSYMMRKIYDELFEDKTPERRQQTADMNALVRMADTEEGLIAAQKAFNKFDKANDSWPGHLDEIGDVIGANLNARTAEFSKYKSALAQAQEYYNSGMLVKEKIMDWDIDKFGDLSKEIRKIGELNDIIVAGNKKFKYSIKGGQSNEMLGRDITSRFNQISAGVKGLAIAKKIPMKLIEPVLMGDSQAVTSMINTERNRVKGLITRNESNLKHAHNILARSEEIGGLGVPVNEKDAGESEFMKMLIKVGKADKSNKYDKATVEGWIKDFTDKQTRLYGEYSEWTGGKFDTSSDLEDLNEQYKKSKKTNGASNIPDGSNKDDETVNAYGDAIIPNIAKVESTKTMFSSEDAMNKSIYGQTSSEMRDSILVDVTGKNLDELRKDTTNKDKSFFQRLKGTVAKLGGLDRPEFKESLERSKRGFKGAVKQEQNIKFNREVKNAENYLAESLWKKMTNKKKSEHKKIANFKDFFSKRMKNQYNEHVNKLGYQGTYLEWIKNQIESSGIYMPIGMGGKWNQ